MKPHHELDTPTCFGTRPFYALLPSVLFAFIGDRRKHLPNLRTGLDRTSGNATIYRSPTQHWRCHSTQPPFKTHSSR